MTVGKVLFPIKKKTNENFHLKNAWKFALKNIGQVFYFDFFFFHKNYLNKRYTCMKKNYLKEDA